MGPSGLEKKKSILVIDDTEAVRRVLAIAFRQQGFEVHEARNAQEAMQRFEAHKDTIAAILLDVEMPNLDGPRILQQLQPGETIPVYFMTAGSTYSREHLLGLGARDVFCKPFSNFVETIRAVVEHAAKPPIKHAAHSEPARETHLEPAPSKKVPEA